MITWGTDALSTSRGIYSKRSDSSIRFIITSQLDMQFWDWSSEAKATKTITLRLDEQCESPLLLSRECSLLLKDVGSKPTSQLIIIQRYQEQPGIANHKAADISGASLYCYWQSHWVRSVESNEDASLKNTINIKSLSKYPIALQTLFSLAPPARYPRSLLA